MIKKFIKYMMLLSAFFLVGVSSFYFAKVFFLKQSIIIDNYFSKHKEKIKIILANKIDIDADQIKIEDVGLEISDLKNFLNLNISNLKITNELNETILKSNKINFKVSLFDLIKGLTNNNDLLLKNIFIDRIEFAHNSNSEIINNSTLNFIRRIDFKKSNFFKDLKINQLNFKFTDPNSILNENLLFECKSLNFDVLNNKEKFLLKCFEKKTKSGVILKNFNYDKNNIFLDGYIKKFDLSLINYKKFLKKFKLGGELNSQFKINFNSNFNVDKIDLKILDNSKIIKQINNKRHQFKFEGFGTFDIKEKTLLLKNLLVDNYNFNGSIVKQELKLLSNSTIPFSVSTVI